MPPSETSTNTTEFIFCKREKGWKEDSSNLFLCDAEVRYIANRRFCVFDTENVFSLTYH